MNFLPGMTDRLIINATVLTLAVTFRNEANLARYFYG